MTLRELINSVDSEQYSERRMAIELELAVTLDDDAIGNLCCQFSITADYEASLILRQYFLF